MTRAPHVNLRVPPLKSKTILFVLLWVAAPLLAAEEGEFYWRVFAHGTAERTNGDERLDIPRVRPKVQYSKGRYSGVLQADLAVDDARDKRPGTLQNGILDLLVKARLGDNHVLTVGQFKTPLGMDFNVPGDRLDITQRGMETGLTLNRDVGVMLTGEGLAAGVSYDVGVFNPPGRATATRVESEQTGDDHLLVGRLRFDRAQWHAEIARGQADNAGGPRTADYRVTDLAVRYTPAQWRFSAEWIEGRDIRGLATREERVFYLTTGYQFNRALQLVARHYDGRSSVSGARTELTNTYLGMTWQLEPRGKLNTRLQLNYLHAGKDKQRYTGLRGFRHNAWFLQLQLHVEK